MPQAPRLKFKLNTILSLCPSVCLIRDLSMHLIIGYGYWIQPNQVTYISYGFFPVTSMTHFLSSHLPSDLAGNWTILMNTG